MDEPKADEPVSLQSILETADDDDLDVDDEASTATDANHPETDQTEATDGQQRESTADEPITQSRRGFSKLMLGGAAGALGLSATSTARASGTSDWRHGYQKYAREYVPTFYDSVATKKNLYKCVKYTAKKTDFWKTLGKKMYLDQAVVTAAYVYPLPNYKPVEKKAWDGILGDMYGDMPKKYRKKRKYPVAVPVVVVYLYDGYYNAVAYLRPYGSSYKSYGYAIKSGYYQDKSYNSKSDYESNTWWWTEDGWGDAGDTEGGILDGIPTGLTN